PPRGAALAGGTGGAGTDRAAALAPARASSAALAPARASSAALAPARASSATRAAPKRRPRGGRVDPPPRRCGSGDITGAGRPPRIGGHEPNDLEPGAAGGAG